MELLRVAIEGALSVFTIDFQIGDFTFNFFQVFMFVLISSAVGLFLSSLFREG